MTIVAVVSLPSGITRTMAVVVGSTVYPQSKTSNGDAQDMGLLNSSDFQGSGEVEGQKLPEAGSWNLNTAPRAREQCVLCVCIAGMYLITASPLISPEMLPTCHVGMNRPPEQKKTRCRAHQCPAGEADTSRTMAEIRGGGCESLTWILHPSLPAGNHLIAGPLLAGPWALQPQQSHWTTGRREQVSAHGIHHHPTRQSGRGAAGWLPGSGQWGAAECWVTPSELLQLSGQCPYLRAGTKESRCKLRLRGRCQQSAGHGNHLSLTWRPGEKRMNINCRCLSFETVTNKYLSPRSSPPAC